MISLLRNVCLFECGCDIYECLNMLGFLLCYNKRGFICEMYCKIKFVFLNCILNIIFLIYIFVVFFGVVNDLIIYSFGFKS